MELIDYQDAIAADWDVVIVGAGMAGLATGLELRKLSPELRVLIISTGGFTGFEHLSKRDLIEDDTSSRSRWSSADLNYSPLPGSEHRIGGRSVCWHGVVLPIDEMSIQNAWPERLVDKMCGPTGYSEVIADLSEWRGTSLNSPQNDSDERTLRLLSTQGLNFSPAPQAATSYSEDGKRLWDVYSPLDAWGEDKISRYRNTGRPSILAQCRVSAVSLDRNDVVGVVASSGDSEFLVKCRHVVLAAGTLENTALCAPVFGSRLRERLKSQSLKAHLVHGLLLRIPEFLKESFVNEDRVLLHQSSSNEHNMFFEIHSDGTSSPILDIWWMAMDRGGGADIEFSSGTSCIHGHIKSKRSPHALKDIEARCELGLDMIRKFGIEPVIHTSRTYPESFALLVEHLQDAELGLGRSVFPYLNPIGWCDHEYGTMPYGDFFDEELQAHGVRGLYLVGAAGFPELGPANPSLTILALSRIAAKSIAST